MRKGQSKTRIYVASRVFRVGMWRKLRDQGFPIISSWIDEPQPSKKTNRELWRRNATDLRMANRCVIYVERADLPLKGVLFEAGACAIRGTPVRIVTDIPIEERDALLGSWIHHPRVSFFGDVRLACRP